VKKQKLGGKVAKILGHNPFYILMAGKRKKETILDGYDCLMHVVMIN
jgi:hypothetical protein